MDGVIYLLNQTGLALAEAQAEIQRLNQVIAKLQAGKE